MRAVQAYFQRCGSAYHCEELFELLRVMALGVGRFQRYIESRLCDEELFEQHSFRVVYIDCVVSYCIV